MARIRTIKPEFFTSEDIVALPAFARLLYIALWCEADKEARLVWKPKTFKMRYFPADDVDIDDLCAALLQSGLVVLYGDGYAHIPTFKAHQHINPRESASQLPEPSTRQPRVGTRQPRVSDAQVGREGKGKEGKEDSAEPQDGSPQVLGIPLVDGTEYCVLTSQVDEWRTAYPAVDVDQELREMRQWAIANKSNRKTPSGILRFITSWLGRAQDKAPRQGDNVRKLVL
jgi:hypothetical protein